MRRKIPTIGINNAITRQPDQFNALHRCMHTIKKATKNIKLRRYIIAGGSIRLASYICQVKYVYSIYAINTLHKVILLDSIFFI